MRQIKFGNKNELFDDAYYIRETVFMKEQGFESEIDDLDETCIHCVVYEGEQPVACGRYYKQNAQIVVGRIAVLSTHRCLGLGEVVMRAIEEHTAYTHDFVLSAQVQARGFYEKLGYHAIGDEYLDEHCPHIKMVKKVD